MGEDNEIVRAVRLMVAEYGEVEALRRARLHYGDQLRGGDPDTIDYWRDVLRALQR